MQIKIILLFCILPALLFSQPCGKIEFIYKFGPPEAKVKNELRTAENIFIKDMLVDSPLVIKLKLTRKEKKLILNKLNEMDFWSYPEKYLFEAAHKDSLKGMPSIYTIYSLRVLYCGKEKQVRWDDFSRGRPSAGLKYERLEALGDLIWKIIFSKKAYKKSRQPRAMYL